MTDVSDLGSDDEVDDIHRFITAYEKRSLRIAEKHLPILIYWDIEGLINRLCKELDESEKKMSSIYGDTYDMVVMANKLFNKVDTL